MRVLLISANRLREPFPVYPIGLDFVAGAISPPHEVRIMDWGVVKNQEDFENEIIAFQPGVVGISIRNVDNVDISASQGYIAEIKKIIEASRKAIRAKIVLGGSGFTVFPNRILSELGADFGIVGEGEKFSLLLKALEEGKEAASIPGILAPGIQSEDLPEPWRGSIQRLIPINNSNLTYYLQQGGMLNLQTKRGCPYGCAYCTYPLIEGKKIRCFEPRDVAAEAIALQKTGARFLFVVDSVFNSDLDHCLSVAEAMEQADLSIPWGAFFSPTPSPPDFYSRLAKAGLTHVEFGTDSLCSQTLAGLNKPFRIKDVYEAHRAAIDAGLNVAHYLALGGPGETHGTLVETLDNAQQLENTVIFIFKGIRIYPGTALHRLAVSERLISKNQDMLDPVFYCSPALTNGEISDIVSVRSRGRINWIVGAGGKKMAALTAMMHRKGFAGPLWEKLVR